MYEARFIELLKNMSTLTTLDFYIHLIINQIHKQQVNSFEQSATQLIANLSISSLSPLPHVQPSAVRFDGRLSSYSFTTTNASSIYHYPSVIGDTRDRPTSGPNLSSNNDKTDGEDDDVWRRSHGTNFDTTNHCWRHYL